MARDDFGWRYRLAWEFRYRTRDVRWGYVPMVVVSIGLVVWGSLGWIGLPK
jgi:hypothetical protein